MQRLRPLNDFIFKKLFGETENIDNLKSFLNAVLNKDKTQELVELEIINEKELTTDNIQDKKGIIDVLAKTSDGTNINIEVQLTNQDNMDKRTLFYWSRIYSRSIVKGEDYSNLNKVITINILDFKYLKNDRFHNGYRLKEIETNEELTDIEEIHFIEIPKLKKLNSEEEVVDMLEAWVEFLRDPESEVVRKLEMSNSEIREAKDKLYKLSMDEKERELYFLREKSIKDEISALANAEEKGIQIGIEQGIKQGIQREKIETVLRLHSLGLNIEQIAKGTCITETEVEKIIKENIN